MLFPTWRSAARAIFGVAAALWLSPAFAHAVCGDRIFPATLGIDDPGVGDELALPTLTSQPQGSDGTREFDATFSWTKTILPGLGLSFSDGGAWLRPGGYGWQALDTELKYNFMCLAQHEFMASAGFDVSWGRTGTAAQYSPFNTYSPILDVGKGFGDLPASLNILRPLAITAEISEAIPGQSWTDGLQNPTMLNWGFTVQYSLPYYNSHIGQIRQRLSAPSDPGDGVCLLDADRQRSVWIADHHRHNPAGRHLRRRHVAARRRGADPDQQRQRPQRRRSRRTALLSRRHLSQLARQTNLEMGSAMNRRSVVRIAAALAFAFVAPAAFAHAQLEKATPAVGATVASATEIRLKFSEGVEPRFSGVALTAEGGAVVPLGQPSVDPADKSVLIVKVGKTLPPGVYTVTWHAVSVDTHHTQGDFQFTVKP